MPTLNPNLPLLVDAICDVYDNPDYRMDIIPDNPETTVNESNKITYCNRAVSEVCERMGYSGFRGMLANGMVEQMEGNLDGWSRISMGEAQGMANQGFLVVAGMKLQPHGHVVVIRPGVEVFSERENGFVPRCLHIGTTAFIGMFKGRRAGVNWAFPLRPGFFTLKA